MNTQDLLSGLKVAETKLRDCLVPHAQDMIKIIEEQGSLSEAGEKYALELINDLEQNPKVYGRQ